MVGDEYPEHQLQALDKVQSNHVNHATLWHTGCRSLPDGQRGENGREVGFIVLFDPKRKHECDKYEIHNTTSDPKHDTLPDYIKTLHLATCHL